MAKEGARRNGETEMKKKLIEIQHKYFLYEYILLLQRLALLPQEKNVRIYESMNTQKKK
jgi:hypothetical protein